VLIGNEKNYNNKNPFQFTESISIEGKTIFFEMRVSEYSKSTGIIEENKIHYDFFL